MEFLLVANPENRRATFFREAVERRGDRCRVISWLEVLAGADVSADLVRIESPGENWQVESALLGRYEPEDLGRIRGIDVAYHRFVEVLQRFEASRFMNTPSAIAAMFDKVTTKQRLHRAGVAVPQGYGLVRTFEELRDVVGRSGRVRFFVKPRHGSSASGVIALSMKHDRVLAVTSVERAGDRLYNSLRLRRYERFDEVERVVDLLGAEDELLVEEWVPKASTQGATFDLRVVAIGDRAEHAVVRLSRHPMTNLHLGNARGDLSLLKAELGARWDDIAATALRALAAFDGVLYGGVDIALTPGFGRLTTFEVNAFGDLLPGVVDARGRSTYEAELDAFSLTA